MSANMKPLETAKNRRQASNCVDNIQHQSYSLLPPTSQEPGVSSYDLRHEYLELFLLLLWHRI
jgi:hypothetical protein